MVTGMRRLLLPATLGLAHGASDGAAGLMLGALPLTLPLPEVGALVLLYNLLAFGGQPVAGLLADRLRRPRAVALAGLLLMCAALVSFGWQARLAILMAGAGSAAFHVGGGALALCATRGRAAGPGLFAAPGVVGLALGGALAVTGHVLPWPFLLALLILFAILAISPLPELPYRTQESDEPIFEGHDYVMLMLLAAIALRSAVWNVYQVLLQGNVGLIVALAIAAAVGKTLGGILADRFGWRRWALGALMISAPLLALGNQNNITLLVGVGLLQSATPAMLGLLAQMSPRYPATAAGLALGLAIALGGVPLLGGPAPLMGAPPVIVATILGAAFIVWLASRRQEKSSPSPVG
jgi:FSR family fosmidomycin resistance protein-like MFS transporter